MIESLDPPTLHSINQYASLLANNRNKIDVSDEEMLSCSMILGYLLKGFTDRYDLENILKKD